MQPYGRRLLYCSLTKLCDAFRVLSTATVLRDVFIVAFGVHVVVVLTHATCERRIDAKASPDKAVVVSKLTDVSMKIQLQIMVG